jgi:hypothetical protein
MKKRDLVLDFTSLLDVIMIILFVVISSMGQASFNAKEEAQKQMEENAGIQQELEIAQQSLQNLQYEYDEMGANNQELQKQVQELLKENNLYKTEDIDKGLLYESLMEKSKKITLICTPYINSNKSNSNEVEITVYSGESGAEQEALDIVIFTHNFDLTREERIAKNAEMQADMYSSLENLIKGNDLELIFITIEYTYGDKNFSQTDLNNIIKAVDDLERNYSITCYIDKVKQ